MLDQYLQREALSLLIESKQSEKARLTTQAELADFRRQMVISRYFEQYLKDAVNDEKIKNFYLSNEAKYSQEKVHVAHLLVRLQRGMSEEDRKARLTVINEAYSKLKAGADFSEIVKQYSEDKVSAKKGGDLGWMKKGAVDVKFSEKIFSTDQGKISQPFETGFGYHIVKVLASPKKVTQSLDSVTGDIRYILRQQVKQARMDELQNELKIEKTN
ncbi:MAG: peptidylprolyl isomerase [Gammaproteobacteria bacterium]|nr:peptidylprolyl isomerase [Gammaproteobacteria bacterium]